MGRAEALRRAMLALMADDERPQYGHPMFWAPFMVVGEGGAAGAGRR
jgi:CHAT domain-containing protein